MSIKRFFATADTTITDAFGLVGSRAYYANIGAASSLELYALSGSTIDGDTEKSRILIKFPISEISQSRSQGKLPSSGSVDFFLRLYNVEHPYSLPKNYTVNVKPVINDWEEGEGVDLDNYIDKGASGSFGFGANWIYAKRSLPWSTRGGDTSNLYTASVSIENGTEDILVNITPMVEAQISGVLPNYGMLLKVSDLDENGSLSRSIYTKRFSGRSTNYFYSKPNIEARWDDSVTDDRSKCKTYLPGMYPNDYTNTIYFYNKPLGYLSNIYTNNGNLTVKLYADASGTQEIIPQYLLVTNPSTGIYKASFRTTGSFSNVYDWWYEGGGTGVVFYKGAITSSIDPSRSDMDSNEEKIINIKNLKQVYSTKEIANIKVFTRKKDWQPNIYSVASNNIESYINNNLYYKIFRYVDNYEIVPYGTGSVPYTKASSDKNGNYFSLDMSLFEPGYAYGIKFGLLEGDTVRELAETFRFKVE